MRRVWGDDAMAPGLFAPPLGHFSEVMPDGDIHEGFKAANFMAPRPDRMLGVIMLNPSTADASVLDPTNRRVVSFALGWGYAGVVVGNIFALRSTDPAALHKEADPVGRDNMACLASLCGEVGAVLCAWGRHGELDNAGANAMKLLGRLKGDKPVYCLGLNRDGSPKHPLYVASETRMMPFEVE